MIITGRLTDTTVLTKETSLKAGDLLMVDNF